MQSIGGDVKNRLYEVDYSLRPEGRKGVLARSLEGCIDYYENWASTWERQALIRARFAAGSAEVAKQFFEIVEPFVWSGPPTREEVREIRHLKARMENERIPRNGDPNFNLKLGPGSLSDVEWTVQLLQLQTGVRGQNTLESLITLERAGHIPMQAARTLDDAWRFCDFTRNRCYIVGDLPLDGLPSDLHTLAVLARSLEIPELRERYQQATRRARSVVERLFYGQE